MVAASGKLPIQYVQLLQLFLILILLGEMKLNRETGIPADSLVMSIK